MKKIIIPIVAVVAIAAVAGYYEYGRLHPANTNTLTTTNTGGVVFTGSLSGTGSLTIAGTGTLDMIALSRLNSSEEVSDRIRRLVGRRRVARHRCKWAFRQISLLIHFAVSGVKAPPKFVISTAPTTGV